MAKTEGKVEAACGCGHDHEPKQEHVHEDVQGHDRKHDDGRGHESCSHDHEYRHQHVLEDKHEHGHEDKHEDMHEPILTHGDADTDAIRQTLPLTGLHCADCAMKLEKVVAAMSGVTRVEVSLAHSTMSLNYQPTRSSYRDIVRKIRQIGYDVVEPQDAVARKGRRQSAGTENGSAAQSLIGFWRSHRKARTTAFAGLLFVAAWVLSLAAPAADIATDIGYALAIAIGGFAIARSGIAALASRVVGMEMLMTIAVAGAAAIGEWQEGAAVVVLFNLGETLEALTMDRTRRSIRSLMDLSPAEATVVRGGEELRLAVAEIAVGDRLLLKPGEKIAMDGRIAVGRSFVNQAPITGESEPVEKQAGDEVFAGTINQHGSLEVDVTRVAADSTLSRIIRMVEEAQAQKAPTQRFVDRFAQYYTPTVVLLAVAIFAVPVLLFQQAWEPWFYRALMLLVVSCPCALLISTPVTVIAAIGHAAKAGILIKGGAYLERLGKVTAVAFDKTGTLTEGHPSIVAVAPFGGHSREELLRLAAGVEALSEHPTAEAVVRLAREEGLAFAAGREFVAYAGRGAKAEVGGAAVWIGNTRWVEAELGLAIPAAGRELIRRWEEEGRTVMVLGTADGALGALAAADPIRASSREAIARLSHIGVAGIVMLTGDNEGAARRVAAAAGGIGWRAQLLPQDKLAAVRGLMQQGDVVAMVGDGINDAPALAVADVGVAMGAAGTGVALETADVALMADDLGKLPYAIRLGRRALGVIRQNIAFSLLVKAIFIALIFAGKSTLWLAVLADTGASLIVIANGMRLLRTRKAGSQQAHWHAGENISA
jgi:Cd2+/Zn2+-exporting ATPase